MIHTIAATILLYAALAFWAVVLIVCALPVLIVFYGVLALCDFIAPAGQYGDHQVWWE